MSLPDHTSPHKPSDANFDPEVSANCDELASNPQQTIKLTPSPNQPSLWQYHQTKNQNLLPLSYVLTTATGLPNKQ